MSKHWRHISFKLINFCQKRTAAVMTTKMINF